MGLVEAGHRVVEGDPSLRQIAGGVDEREEVAAVRLVSGSGRLHGALRRGEHIIPDDTELVSRHAEACARGLDFEVHAISLGGSLGLGGGEPGARLLLGIPSTREVEWQIEESPSNVRSSGSLQNRS